MSRILLLSLAIALAFATPGSAEIIVEETSFTQESWVRPQERIRIRLNRLPGPGEGGLAVFVGNVDLTSQFDIRGKELVFASRDLRLPPGEQELAIYWVRGPDDWDELGRFPIRVLTRLGFERAGVEPDVDVNIEDQFQGLTSDLGIATDHARAGFEVDSRFEFLGTTARERALQFNELQDDARRFDLAGYRARLRRGPASFAVGDVRPPANRLLAQDLANRGALIRYGLENRADLAVAAVNGRRIVGFDNFFGLSDFQSNNIRTGTVGLNPVWALGLGRFAETLGTWRLEGSVLDGQVESERGFNTGEVVDVEESFGFDLRLQGESGGGRLRMNLEFARSRFDNPSDPSLFQQVAVVDVDRSTDDARLFEATLDVLQDLAVWGDQRATVTVGGRHERLDPLFASVGSLVTSDQETNEASLAAVLGVLAVDARQRWFEDNLDDIPSILKTKTRESVVTTVLPFRSFFATDTRDSWWIPSFSYDFSRIRQEGVNRPSFEQSAFEPSQIPDQRTAIHQLGADWSGDPWSWSLGYRFALADQDNRQPGREEADFRDRTHEVQVGLRPLDPMLVNAAAFRTSADNEEIDLTRTTRSATLNVDWEVFPSWFFSGNYSYTDEDDSDQTAIFRNVILETQLAHQFELPGPNGTPLPVRLFVRHAFIDTVAKDRLANVAFEDDDSRVDGGVSFSF